MKNFKLISAIAVVLSLFCNACREHDHETAQENITRVTVTLKGINGSNFDTEFTWKDANFDKIPDSIDSIAIPANTKFAVTIKVFDDTTTPTTDLSEEIKGESNDHLFVLKSSSGNLVISDLNTDSSGKPFGIESIWSSGAVAQGDVRIQLYHEPTDKSASNPGGEIDFDVSFSVIIR